MTSLTFSLIIALLGPAEIDRARQLFEAGGEAYHQGRYRVAIGAFDEAHRLAARPAILFSLAQACRLQYFVDGQVDDLTRAVDAYRRYIEQVPEGGRRDHAVQHLSTLAPMLDRLRAPPSDAAPPAEAPARLIISSEIEGARARVDGGPPSPIPATFEVAPGERRVVVEADEHLPEARTLLAVAGSAVALNLDPEPLPGRLIVEVPAGARIFLNGQGLGAGPLEGPIEAPAGQHVVVVTERGRLPFEQPVSLRRGEAVVVAAELPVSRQRIAAWGLVGTAAALAVGSGIFTHQALSAEADAQELEDRLDRQGFTVAEARRYRSLEASRDDHADWATGLGVLAGTAAITATLLWFFDEPESPRPTLQGAPRATVRF